MAEIFILIFQFLGELLLQFLGELLLEILGSTLESQLRRRTNNTVVTTALWPRLLALLAGGACLGALSLLILPHSLIQLPALRILNLLLAPFAVGFCTCMLSWLRWHFSGKPQQKAPFLKGFCACLGLVIVRFIFGDPL